MKFTVPNLFVTFEGNDGAGKTKQAFILYDHIRKAGHKVILTREPGGYSNKTAESIRDVIFNNRENKLMPETLVSLFMASRSEHLYHTIMPHLVRGYFIVCDRFVDSTAVYQSRGNLEDLKRVYDLHALMFNNFMPDLTIVLIGDVRVMMQRTGNVSIAGEMAEYSRLVDLQDCYMRLGEIFPDRIRYIDTNQKSVAEVEAMVRLTVTQFYARYNYNPFYPVIIDPSAD